VLCLFEGDGTAPRGTPTDALLFADADIDAAEGPVAAAGGVEDSAPAPVDVPVEAPAPVTDGRPVLAIAPGTAVAVVAEEGDLLVGALLLEGALVWRTSLFCSAASRLRFWASVSLCKSINTTNQKRNQLW
jgi:hypothetical protein